MQEPITAPVTTDELRIVGTHVDGSIKVERKHVRKDHSTTQGYHLPVPAELAAFIDGPAVDVADLPDDIRAWVDGETEVLQ